MSSSQDCEIETKASRKDLNLPQKENISSNQETNDSENERKTAESDSNTDNQGLKIFIFLINKQQIS